MDPLFTFERSLKKLFPTSVKVLAIKSLILVRFGFIIKRLNPKRTLSRNLYDFTNVTHEEAVEIFFGSWESAEIRIAKNFIKSPVIVELGSSIGVLTSALSSCKEKKRFYLIDANVRNIKILTSIVAFLKQICKVKHSYAIYNYCISGSPKTVNFSIRSTSGSRISSIQQDPYPTYEMNTTTLSQFLRANLPSTNYCLISDIEGEEASIFFDDPESLDLCSEIVVELEKTEIYSINDQIDRLNQLHFQLVYRYGNVAYFKKIQGFE